jgi:ammonium transporter, Amt family
MTSSRRWLLVPFVAVCAFLLGGPVFSQEPDPKTKGGGKAKSTAKADDAVLADLKKSLAEARKELAVVKQSSANAAKTTEETKRAAAAALTKAEAATEGIDTLRKDLDAKKGPTEEEQKAADELKQTAEGGVAAAGEAKSKGDTAWMLTSSAFVMLMLPGLALFYGGMVRRKNILATMMHSMGALSVVGLYWVAVGYALAFGPSVARINLLGVEDGGLLGWSWDLFFLKGINTDQPLPGTTIPVYVHMMFQGMFAIITPALISGAVAERVRFWPFCLFMVLWITFVYCPLAHMVWAFDWFDPTVAADKQGLAAIGLLGKLGALDFAGGTVVHIAAGVAGLAACLILRKRDGYPKSVIHPNSMVLTLLGAGLLWFGWFGFNGGSAGASNAVAGSAFAATQAAAAAAGLGWMVVEWLHKGKPTALGLASGIVAGLVAVTPASGYVYVWGAVAIGLAAAVLCYLAVYAKGLLGYDDSLDAFGIHGVGGFVGAVLTGLFCYSAVNAAGNDGFFAVRGYLPVRVAELETKLIPEARAAGASAADQLTKYEEELTKLKDRIDKGPLTQFWVQTKAAVFATVFAVALSALLVVLTQALTLGNFTTDKQSEVDGLDRTEHGEVGFDMGYATETVAFTPTEPKAATFPKGNGRFEVAVEGVNSDELLKNWTALCQPSETPPDPDFLAVYPHVTTVSGNTFRLRGGDPAALTNRMESLFKKLIPGKPVKAVRV